MDLIGLADETTYASLISKHLLARDRRERPGRPLPGTDRRCRPTTGPAGLDWQSGRDFFGVSSIDVLVDRAALDAIEERKRRSHVSRSAAEEARIAKVDALLTAAGLPPVRVSRGQRSLDPIYTGSRKGKTIADYPELRAEFDPALNGGKVPEQIAAASVIPAQWTCREHRSADGSGHDHVFPATPEQRTRGSRCPVYSGHQACPTTCQWPPWCGRASPSGVR